MPACASCHLLASGAVTTARLVHGCPEPEDLPVGEVCDGIGNDWGGVIDDVCVDRESAGALAADAEERRSA